jgi:hypothetical protein
VRFIKILVCLAALAACQASFAASISAQPAHNDFGPFARAIEQFGGQTVDPTQFPNDLNGFQQYLNASGVRSVDAHELTYPNHPDVAAKYGFAYFLPPQAWWPRGAALALLAQQLEHRVGETVSVRNWWRPPVYNRDPKVGGAEKGDHIGGFGMDLDYNSSQARRRAEQWLRGLANSQPWLRLSLGLGDRTTHIGMLSPRGSREWHYASYPR